MRFADEHAERAPGRHITRGDGRGVEVEMGAFDRAIERLDDAASDGGDRGVSLVNSPAARIGAHASAADVGYWSVESHGSFGYIRRSPFGFICPASM
jgi:hypothetical protein